MQTTRFNSKSRKILEKLRGEVSAIIIELTLVLTNYSKESRRIALTKMLRNLDGDQDGKKKDNRQLLKGEDR